MQRKNKKTEEIILDGKKLKIAVVVSKFNQDITEKMLEGALKILKKNAVPQKNIRIIWVPGSFEIPLACQWLAKNRKYDALVALGCVIKGETDHYYYVAGESSRGIMQVSLENSLPIGFGIITTNNLSQAKKRSQGRTNKGEEATEAALEMLKIRK